MILIVRYGPIKHALSAVWHTSSPQTAAEGLSPVMPIDPWSRQPSGKKKMQNLTAAGQKSQ